MFTLTVRDHIMIAHSLKDPGFGPAQQTHGATYVIDAIFRSDKLDHMNVVIDIGEASELLKKAIKPINYQNLDDLTEFQNVLTTTEYLARHIHQKIIKEIPADISLKIVLNESHIASASYEE